MRQVQAKFLKAQVIDKMYGEDLSKEQRKSVIQDPKFKQVYRARKKNYNTTRQQPLLKTSRRQQRLEKSL